METSCCAGPDAVFCAFRDLTKSTNLESENTNMPDHSSSKNMLKVTFWQATVSFFFCFFFIQVAKEVNFKEFIKKILGILLPNIFCFSQKISNKRGWIEFNKGL